MSKWKFVTRKVNFRDCGLDIERNILQAVMCPCGCGNYMDVCLRTEEELYDFIANMLSMEECEHCAIFVLHADNKTVTVGDSDGERITFISFRDDKTGAWNADLVKDWQKKFNFHCYGLLEEKADRESYRIVME